MRVDEPMLSIVATRRSDVSRSGDMRPIAAHAPLNSSISAISLRISGVIVSVPVRMPPPIVASNSIHSQDGTGSPVCPSDSIHYLEFLAKTPGTGSQNGFSLGGKKGSELSAGWFKIDSQTLTLF
jgi:hypothetical protein